MVLVGDGTYSERLPAGVGHRCGQGVTVSVIHVPRLSALAGLNQLVANRNHHHARHRVHRHALVTQRSQQRHLTRPNSAALRKHGSASLNVLTQHAHPLTSIDLTVNGHLRLTPVGELPGNHGVGPNRHGRTRVNQHRSAGHKMSAAHIPRTDGVDNIQHHRRGRGGADAVLGAHRVTVQTGQIRGGHIHVRNDICS